MIVESGYIKAQKFKDCNVSGYFPQKIKWKLDPKDLTGFPELEVKDKTGK